MPADRTSGYTPPPIHAAPIRIPGTSPGKAASLINQVKHGRARSTSGSSSSHAGTSRAVAPFPTLLATNESVLEQNLYDIMWKTFVAFEQDMRDCRWLCSFTYNRSRPKGLTAGQYHSQLAPLLPGIEATVSSAVDPITLASDCLADTASYIEGEIRDAIEEALANGGTMLSSSPASSISDGGTRTILSCPISYSKQFSLASTRISGCCSTFRATQASLRYYGGARKTAYQLDLFVHKFALPTSTALHKRGQEFSAANKWLKRMLNGEGRMLDTLEMAALRRAATALKHWAEGLRIHSDILRSAAQNVRTLLQERVSLQAYSFPPRPSPLEYAAHFHQGGSSMIPMAAASPMSLWTTINSLNTPSSVYSGLPELGSSFSPSTAPSSLLATPENCYAQIIQKGFAPSSVSSSYSPSPMSQHSLPPSIPQQQNMPNSQSLPQSSYPQQSMSPTLPQQCGFAFATPTFVQDQSIYQSQLAQQQQQGMLHQQQQQQMQFGQQQNQQQLDLQHAAYANGLVSPPVATPDLSIPSELFFDNLCM